jgi:predicted ester cyclase
VNRAERHHNSPSELDSNKAVITTLFEALGGGRGIDYASVAPDVINHTASSLGLRDGAENFKRVMEIVQAVDADQKWKMQALIAEGDLVACRVTWSGTHRGSFLGVAATNLPFSVEHMHVFRVTNGQIAEHWAVRDDLAMLGQIGTAYDPRARSGTLPRPEAARRAGDEPRPA